jgi:hypothetical protein
MVDAKIRHQWQFIICNERTLQYHKSRIVGRKNFPFWPAVFLPQYQKKVKENGLINAQKFKIIFITQFK